MRLELTARDVIGLLGAAAAAALAVSLGLDPSLAAELTVVVALLLLVAVLLRAAPEPDRTPPTVDDRDALTTARGTVEAALSGPWGVRGRFRRIVRTAVRARLAHRERDLADITDDLPPELALLLTGQWEHDRGLTPAELDRILTAVEELEP